VVAGFAERSGDQVYNAALLANGDGVRGCYRKVHLFNREKVWFSPGDGSFPVFRVGEANVGLMICFDWIFPEAARSLALRGAEIIAHPANLVLPYCQEAMKTRCLENRVFAITANRIGTERRGEDDLTFTGASQITSPRAEILSSAPIDCTHVDVVEIDPMEARDKKVNPFNHVLDDRRPAFYDLDGPA
jgi:predicted amidohydrolase